MRDKSVSLAKGIAIALVVLIHSLSPGLINRFFSMLVVPTFFFMSGYCFKDNYLDDAYKFWDLVFSSYIGCSRNSIMVYDHA